jgi:hypothetical protein
MRIFFSVCNWRGEEPPRRMRVACMTEVWSELSLQRDTIKVVDETKFSLLAHKDFAAFHIYYCCLNQPNYHMKYTLLIFHIFIHSNLFYPVQFQLF